MSRQPRAGTAAGNVTIRATPAERASWERAAKAEGCATLSAWLVKTANERAARVAPPAKSKRSGR